MYCTKLSDLSAKTTPLAFRSDPIPSQEMEANCPAFLVALLARRNPRNPLELAFLSNTRYTLLSDSGFVGGGSFRSHLLSRMAAPEAISPWGKFLSDVESQHFIL
jgi:hypothetical protein